MAYEEWRPIRLGDFVGLQRGYDLTASDRRSGSVPVIGSAGISGYHDEARCKGPGVTIGRSGVGSIGVLTYTVQDFWPHNTTLFVTDFHGNDPRFAYYLLGTLGLRRHDSGSAQSSLNRNNIYSIKFNAPFPSEQRAISRVLGALDDKIDLNRRMNETLEAIAKAIFQSWFVDFDPVRAKMEGRPPHGMGAETAGLFSDSFEVSSLGQIPSGWGARGIGDFNEGLYDGLHATPPEAGEGPVFLGIGNLLHNRIDLSQIRHISEDDWPRWTRRVIPRQGDIVFTYEATLGLFAMIPGWLRCCLGRRLALIRPKPNDEITHFLYHTFTSKPFQEFLASRTVPGATVDRISLLEFPSYPVLLPPANLIKVFEGMVRPLWEKLHSNLQEKESLSDLRDALLPKLLSGEIRVKDAETLMESV
jgi:type I restriction enzyme S subunit